MSLGDGAGPGAGAASSSDDDLRRVLDAALRLKHRLSLVATLPAVRRVRDFLNPGSRLPDSASPLVLLGRRHEAHASFAEDFAARTWVTYRRGFPPLANSTYTSDAGWGCTLRSGQMLLANALGVHFFGRDWSHFRSTPRRRSDPETNDERNETDERPSPADPEGNDDDDDVDSDSSPDSDSDSDSDGVFAAGETFTRWFGDVPDASASPFGVHAFFSEWGAERGLVPGRWLGPCVVAEGIAALANKAAPGGLLAHVVGSEEGGFGLGGGAPAIRMRAVKKKIRDEASRRHAAKEDVPRDAASDAASDERERKAAASSPPPGGRFDLPSAPFARTLAQSPSCGWCPTLLLVPLVLGLEKTLNPRYVPSLVAALGLRQSVGVLGGRPGSSLYFVGAQDERLFYLDPHTVQPALEVSDGRSDGGLGGAASPREFKKKPRRVRFSARTYRCASTLNMDGRDLDPSMALGFYCRAESDFDELCLELELMSTRAGSTPICTVCRKGDEDEKAPPSVKATATDGGGPSVSENLSGADRDEARLSDDDDEDWEMI